MPWLRFTYCNNLILFAGQKFALNEEKCVISTLLRNFNIESTLKDEDTHPVSELILRPRDGIKIKLTKRTY